MFRDGATRLRLSESKGELVIAIEFESAEIGGALTITVGETISVKDSLVFAEDTACRSRRLLMD